MDRILHDARNAEKILQITSDTLIMVAADGICVDVDTHSSLWFLQEEHLLGKDISELLPAHTYRKILPVFRSVISERKSISKNFRLELKDGTYYFECIMHPYDNMVLCQYRDITARSNVKLQLERTNYELEEIQKAAHIGQWKYRSDGQSFCYRGYAGLFLTEDVKEISFERYFSLVVEDDRETFRQWVEHNGKYLKEDGINFRIAYNGEMHYLRAYTFLRERQPDGSYNMEGYIQDMTDVQRHRNNINTLTHAINNAKESIFAAQEDGTMVFANRQFRQNHCLPPNEDMGDYKIYNLVGNMHTLEAWQERCRSVKQNESSNFIAYLPQKQNPDVLASEGTIYRATNDEGEVNYWSFSHDITERLRYESQIKRLNRIMDTTMDILPAGIVVKDVDNDYRYIYRNKESYNREIASGDAIGKNDFDYYPLEIAEKKRQEDMRIAATGKGIHCIMEGNKDKNGNLLILDKQKIMVESEDFSPIIISIEWDITQLEQMKREILVAKERAENSDKQKSAFLANMSHEIRTPLNAIIGFSRIIAESEDVEERKAYYEIVEANNERLLQLINEILDLSKIESGIVEFVFAPVRLHTLCKEIHDAHIFRTPEGVELIYEPSDETILIDSDKNRIFQVLSNLIGNAFKFTTKGSISYGYRQEGEQIVFHVTDTGTGIEPEKVGKVFERFMKLNNTAQGTGLGLSICKTIIERLGGEISVSSEIGVGTTFSFWLPSRELEESINTCPESTSTTSIGEDGPVGTEIQEPPYTADSKATVLIAEDSDGNYDLLCAILGKTYNLVRAKDGMEAITRFEEAKPDLVLMDIKMPNLNGLEATMVIRELSTEVPIIIQSAYAYEYDRNAATKAGCTDFVSKPVAQEKLKALIKKYLKS